MASLRGKRVLIVEDEFLIADDLQRIFRQVGAIVVGPVGGRDEAMETIASQVVDLAVLDIRLREEPVYPVADELRRRRIPFMFVTGYGEEAVRSDLRSVAHIQTPYEPEKLLAMANRLAGSQ